MKPPNPFDFSLEWLAQHLTGRAGDVRNVSELLLRGGASLVSGESGTGKTATAMRAAMEAVRGTGGICVRLDLSLSETLVKTADEVKAQLGGADKPGQKSGAILGDLATAAGKTISLPLSEEAGLDAVDAVTSLLRNLREGSRSGPQPIFIVLDSVEKLRDFRPLQKVCEEVGRMGGPPPCSILLCARTDALERICAQVPAIGGDASKRLGLPELSRPVLAQWIDNRMQSGGVVSNAAGNACVERADGNPAKAVQLAKRTFELSVSARYANKGAVETAFKLDLQAAGGDTRAGQGMSKLSFDFSLLRGARACGQKI